MEQPNRKFDLMAALIVIVVIAAGTALGIFVANRVL